MPSNAIGDYYGVVLKRVFEIWVERRDIGVMTTTKEPAKTSTRPENIGDTELVFATVEHLDSANNALPITSAKEA